MFRLISAPGNIRILPLPEEGKPVNFTGAVGDFKFEVTTNNRKLDANESFELSVRVSGIGNLKLFDLPSIKLPSSLEVYEPTRADDIRTQHNGMTGAMIKNYTVVSQFKGTYPIRPISFSYFNPKTETYSTLSSEEIIIEVENGPVSAESTRQDSKDNGNKQAVVLNSDQFKYIKLKANLEPMTKEHFFKSKLFWSLFGVPFLIIPLFILIGRKRKQRLADVEGKRLRRANMLAKKYLSEARKNMSDKITFYDALERALHNYLKAKLNIETGEMEKGYISKLLLERSVQPPVVTGFVELLRSCEYARYAPTSKVTISIHPMVWRWTSSWKGVRRVAIPAAISPTQATKNPKPRTGGRRARARSASPPVARHSRNMSGRRSRSLRSRSKAASTASAASPETSAARGSTAPGERSLDSQRARACCEAARRAASDALESYSNDANPGKLCSERPAIKRTAG